jgi:NTP pyrophosphatase (non-canonical NTP hydrolase)
MRFWGRPREDQQTIEEWRRATFGPGGSNARLAARLNTEVAELIFALTEDDSNPQAIDEVADIGIVLMGLCSRFNVDFHQIIDQKMAINRRRQWLVDGTGHGHHIEQEEAASDHAYAQ